MKSNFSTIPISGRRIALATKIYYFSDPLRWTMYDSRVGFAIHQLIFEYSKKLGVSPSSLFSDIPFCLPEEQYGKRNPIFSISGCYGSETKAKASFIWASHLLRLTAFELNKHKFQNPLKIYQRCRHGNYLI